MWRKSLSFVLAALMVLEACPLTARADEMPEPAVDAINFPDDAFRAVVAQSWDTDRSGTLSQAELAAVTQIDVSGRDIASVKGVELFTELTVLHCQNNALEALDLSGNPKLQELRCHGNLLTDLNVKNCRELRTLFCGKNRLSKLDLTGCTRLATLQCHENRLSGLDVSGCPDLDFLICADNRMSFLEVSANPLLTELQADGNSAQRPELTDDRRLDLGTIPGFDAARAEDWENGTVADGVLTADDGADVVRFTYDVDGKLGDKTAVFTWEIPGRQGIALDERTFPDENFRRVLSQTVDTTRDRVLTREEIAAATSLDVTGWRIASLEGIDYLTELKELACGKNQLTDLDLSALAGLEVLNCENNCLPWLDVSANPLLTELRAGGNTAAMEARWDRRLELSTLDGFDPRRASDWTGGTVEGNILTVDNGARCVGFTYDVDGDLGSKTAAFTWEISFLEEQTELPVTNQIFPDEGFRAYVQENCDTDGDGKLSREEVAAVTVLRVRDLGIGSLEGIQYFTALTCLDCSRNDLTTLNLTQNRQLEQLFCGQNRLGHLDLSGSQALVQLNCDQNELTELDLSACPGLKELSCCGNRLSSLDVSGSGLEILRCSGNALLERLNAGSCPGLRIVDCGNSGLTALDLSNDGALEELDCTGNRLSQLNLGGSTALVRLRCGSNWLTALDLSANLNLKELRCGANMLPCLDIGPVELLEAEGNVAVLELGADGTLDLSAVPGFDPLRASDWQGAAVSGNVLTAGTNQVTFTYDVDGDWGEGTAVFTWKLRLVDPGELAVDAVHFPDDHFRAYVQRNVDRNRDGSLSRAEMEAVTQLHLEGREIASLDGIGYFPELTGLYCGGNLLTRLNLTGLDKLKTLSCRENRLTALDLDGCPLLTELDCSFNQLDRLDLSQNDRLESLACGNNQLTQLNVGSCPEMKNLICCGNQLEALDLSRNNILENLSCDQNRLTALDVRKCPGLTKLSCDDNRLTTLALPEGGRLEMLSCSRNELAQLNVSPYPELSWLLCGGNRLTELEVSTNQKLEKLYCPDNELFALDVRGCTALTELSCGGNCLAWLEIGGAKLRLDAAGNRAPVEKNADGVLDLSSFRGFDPSRASNWTGAVLTGTVLTPEAGNIGFTYDVDGSHGDQTADFVWELTEPVHVHSYTEAVPSEEARKTGCDCMLPPVYYKSCQCGQISTREEDTFTEGRAPGHKFSPWEETVQGSCVSEGVLAHCTCAVCGKHFGRHGDEITELMIPLDPNHHVHTEEIPWINATCTEDGWTAGVYCRDCGCYISGHERIPASHQLGQWMKGTPAACIYQGTAAHQDCVICGKHFDRDGNEIADLIIPIDPQHHVGSAVTQNGPDGPVRVCSSCKAVLTPDHG